jgi:hypothetical protein
MFETPYKIPHGGKALGRFVDNDAFEGRPKPQAQRVYYGIGTSGRATKQKVLYPKGVGIRSDFVVCRCRLTHRVYLYWAK